MATYGAAALQVAMHMRRLCVQGQIFHKRHCANTVSADQQEVHVGLHVRSCNERDYFGVCDCAEC